MILRRGTKEPIRPREMIVLFPASLDIESADSIIVEIGPGRGDFLYHLAEKNPKSLIVAIEIKRKRVDKLVYRLQKRGIENVLLVQSDAKHALPELFKEGSLDEIHINFPDPWPKKRHAKNRLLSPPFLNTCIEKLKINGKFHFATDQGWYASNVNDLLKEIPGFSSCYDEAVVINPEDAFPTLFMQKWRDMGRTLHYQKYRKIVL